jgi:uncharacterized phiE125 gp8 family phage protein
VGRLVLARTVEPAVELVSTAEAKAHLRVDHSEDDTYIGSLITAAREHIEETTARALVTQTWTWKLDRFPGDGVILLPRPPLQSVTSITYIDGDGAEQTLAASLYDVHTDELPGRISRAFDATWPITRRQPNAVTGTYVAGYGDLGSDTPEAIRHAALLIIGDLYRNREERITGTIVARLRAVDQLLGPYRTYWF